MGIMRNIRNIIDFQKHKNMEVKFQRDLIKRSMVETTFYEKYSSFVVGLRDKLRYLLLEEGYTEVTLRPTEIDNAKYFERVMEDRQFTSVYNVKRTSGGEYVFRQKSFEDKAEELGYEEVK